ncbi:MAG TPA: hydantoinase/oxoprolinase family protein [Gemmatimonadaceae bacterium]|nr:hydantoinase/oxoprolinase family protein [Gemmatimonadaceae bacterium]
MRAGLDTSVGIDTGGTFTDLVAVDASGGVTSGKVLSTPGDQSEAVANVLGHAGPPGAQTARIVHGTTVVTNTLLERNGARVVLCATEGATDLLLLRRQERASLYDLTLHHPAPLVADGDVVPVAERREPGVVRITLTADAIARACDAVVRLSPDTVAIALLHGYDDDTHERALAASLRKRLPGVEIVGASEILPEIREYERTATAACEAYVRPRAARYLDRLAGRLTGAGFPLPDVMSSSGGTLSLNSAARSTAALALSGPAGGVTGAGFIARQLGVSRALTVDIGGTSADVGLVLDGEPLIESGGQVAGVPIALPRVLVETVSAGGGSIAWVDDGGALRVGPHSAGAVPGPVAFARGGTLPTVTDAQVVLGRIGSARIAGGVAIDAAAASAAVATLAEPLGAAVERVAEAIIGTADAAMARALRRVSVERGIDPRSCALIAFGGGGPLHACGLADGLGITRVIVPPLAGVLSAFGLAIAPERRVALASLLRPAAGVNATELDAVRERLLATVGGASSDEDTVAGMIIRARYAGQGHDLDVPVNAGDDGATVARAFAHAHRARYGFVLDRPVEFVSVRAMSSRRAHAAHLRRRGGAGSWRDDVRVDDGGACEARVAGAASVVLDDATMFVARDWTARALPSGGWMLERDA